MTSLAGGRLGTTVGQKAISQGEELKVEQHRTDRLELLHSLSLYLTMAAMSDVRCLTSVSQILCKFLLVAP